jgi:hypothetical protein
MSFSSVSSRRMGRQSAAGAGQYTVSVVNPMPIE